MIDEPAFPSTRTDAASYTDYALASFAVPLDKRQTGYVRDAISEAFLAGEHQGECRAIIVMSIARANATDPATRAALGACLRVLGAGGFLAMRINWKARALRAEDRLLLLEELYDDVERWRETGGDPRDLRYILDTLEKIEAQEGTDHDTSTGSGATCGRPDGSGSTDARNAVDTRSGGL